MEKSTRIFKPGGWDARSDMVLDKIIKCYMTRSDTTDIDISEAGHLIPIRVDSVIYCPPTAIADIHIASSHQIPGKCQLAKIEEIHRMMVGYIARSCFDDYREGKERELKEQIAGQPLFDRGFHISQDHQKNHGMAAAHVCDELDIDDQQMVQIEKSAVRILQQPRVQLRKDSDVCGHKKKVTSEKYCWPHVIKNI
ncbi:hypothetical protein DERF_010975 [Dermatophagoides farinae]|uniref:Uncharacterized protein n=1 Tax=Dermatophagoides farinae TaxID=6954 RepID=A0A922HVA7_DERFA|nr:hypothetical protein DERF_010975 [Dermatophagoides farinae]